ncbi:hypothetical protein AVEN_233615-1 [Araneus ventricosus]|uniref:Uncharacterized protein n=1 Tax=Araneus ventricosus TaxID=182803 RepID=A0A4Y2S6S6_ARAVE|nr:hypothetical protein AVEN_233615-1 [Araneus ventricosus]
MSTTYLSMVKEESFHVDEDFFGVQTFPFWHTLSEWITPQSLLLSRIRRIQRESIVIVKKFQLDILTHLHVLDLPETEKHSFRIMSVYLSVSEHDNSKTVRATGMKFGM